MSVSISSVFGWFGGLLLRGQQTFLCWSPGRKPRNLFFSRLFCALLGSLYLFVLVLPLWFFLLPISLCFLSPSLFFFLSYFFVCFCHVFFCLSFCLCSLRMWPFSGFYRAKECPLFVPRIMRHVRPCLRKNWGLAGLLVMHRVGEGYWVASRDVTHDLEQVWCIFPLNQSVFPGMRKKVINSGFRNDAILYSGTVIFNLPP